MTPVVTRDIDRLYPALDRLQEAHFFLHGLEVYYHVASPFRWHLNTFLRALKEVPQIISTTLQNRPGFPSWYKEQRRTLLEDSLIGYLGKQRDFVVHSGMLRPSSRAMIGVTEGQGMNLAVGGQFDPLSDSNDAIRRYVDASRTNGDFFGVLEDDDDSLPAVERRWSLQAFGDIDLVELCATAWLTMGDHLSSVVSHIGE